MLARGIGFIHETSRYRHVMRTGYNAGAASVMLILRTRIQRQNFKFMGPTLDVFSPGNPLLQSNICDKTDSADFLVRLRLTGLQLCSCFSTEKKGRPKTLNRNVRKRCDLPLQTPEELHHVVTLHACMKFTAFGEIRGY